MENNLERRSISLSKAIQLEDSIGWLSRIIPQNYEMFMIDDNNVELIEETKLLNELALLNKRRNEILDELTKTK